MKINDIYINWNRFRMRPNFIIILEECCERKYLHSSAYSSSDLSFCYLYKMSAESMLFFDSVRFLCVIQWAKECNSLMCPNESSCKLWKTLFHNVLLCNSFFLSHCPYFHQNFIVSLSSAFIWLVEIWRTGRAFSLNSSLRSRFCVSFFLWFCFICNSTWCFVPLLIRGK